MKLKHICYILPFIILVACKNGETEKENSAKQDSIKKAARIAQIEEAKKNNAYLIEPPDTNYSGDYVDKYENGNTKFKGFFRFGKRHGQWVAFYANGLMWSECYYNKGLRHGSNTVYFENGKPRYKGWFKNDLRDSVWVFYDQYGTEIQKITFKDDQEVNTSK
jgi:antitoxin component YwqK of YwqJK toxin-antitoxin module